MERAGADFLEGQVGGERFLFRDCAAGDSAKEEIEQALTGCGVVKNIAMQRRQRRLPDERFQALGSTRYATEEEVINRGVTGYELRRMEVPPLEEAIAERMQVVFEAASPRRVHHVALADRQDIGRAVGKMNAGPG